MELKERINLLDWGRLTEDINEKGYAAASNILTGDECDELIRQYNNETLYRKTINMERYRFGLGEYKYFQYPLPALVQQLRENVYPKLAPIANNWMRVLNIDMRYPGSLNDLLDLCHSQNQNRPTPLILQYGKGGYNTLHQDLYGDVYFPMQLVLFLNEPDEDYEGGEFVLVEQRPRAQSKAIVLRPRKGDMLLFTTNFRPAKGSKGYYRVNMKHGVSELAGGKRHTLGIIFHDAA
ncbi:2OG-Fe(II) oxygenase [Mucilaginibacter sp.]|uniref:2OG-Fe(II) oxygenase n=1 Tax=Mucilaginibacter sp. TaxID=1882438 RepID=UPI002844C87F|nr:2OG-Fe(II) oxygenase [Mucilaginibacter sp.]MDR3694303.1 2OG-Fe(II) oxygenase [Mucilaginibacter sp.]